MKIVIIGGVAAGASAATKARRCNEKAEIVLFEKGGYVSFANCGLPYHIGNVIQERDELLLVTPELFKDRFNIDVRINHEVIDIDPAHKTVRVETTDGTATHPYDKLVIATGGIPLRPDIPGIDLGDVHTVFTVPDTDGVIASLARGKKTAVVIGGGFIGIETAENLLARGLKTILVEKLPQLMGNMDEEFSGVLERHLSSLGLEIRLNSGLKGITGSTHADGIVLEDGTKIPCDLVILAMGVRPATKLARKAGIDIGETGGVLVDATMRTSDPDIYAAGDMTEALHLVSGKKVRIPLAGSANKQGRVAGACAAGSKLLFQGVIGTSILKVGDLTAARTGLNEREAGLAGLSYRTTYVPGESNATYYPGAESMIIKMTIEMPTGKILGAQIVGRKGVDKRIDIMATAIYGGLTVFDLENLDLAYAPPYSSAKDPVIMGGMICGNILRDDLSYVNPAELNTVLSRENTVLLDVRTQEEFDEGYIEGAVLLPVDDLRKGYKELDPVKTYVIYCGIGYRAYIACLFLNSHGYKTYNLSGGYRAYTMNIL